MASFLIVYGTGEGQTAKISERVAHAIEERGHEATVSPAEEATAEMLDGRDAVLVGASVHFGRHQRHVQEFVSENRDALGAVPSAFFQVSMSSAEEKGQAQAAGYVEAFLDATGWHPDRVGMFGGALRFSRYGFLKRLLIQQIAKEATPGVDTAQDQEFTDWDEVEAFARDVAGFVETRLGPASTPPT